MMRAGVVAVAAVLAAGVAVSVPSSTGAGAVSARSVMAPCVFEDGPGPCVWDASARGNGIGRSLIVTAAGEYVYVSHAAARRLLGSQ